MTFILSLLTSRLSGPIASVVAVILLMLCVGQCSGRVKAEHHAARAEKVAAQAQRDLGTCRSNTSTLEAAVKAQNQAVERLRAEGDARVAQSVKAASAARAVAESYRRDASRILSAKPSGADRCKAADDLISEVAG